MHLKQVALDNLESHEISFQIGIFNYQNSTSWSV